MRATGRTAGRRPGPAPWDRSFPGGAGEQGLLEESRRRKRGDGRGRHRGIGPPPVARAAVADRESEGKDSGETGGAATGG